MTTFGLFLGLAAGWMYAQGSPALTHWAAVVFVIAAWNDHLDGELARMTGKTSTFGHYYDHASAMTSYIALFVGIGIGQAVMGTVPAGIWLGISAGVAIAAIFTIRMWIEIRFGSDEVKQDTIAGFQIEDTLYIVAPVTWLGGLEPFIWAAGIGTPIFLLWVIFDAFRTYRRLTGAGARKGEGSGNATDTG